MNWEEVKRLFSKYQKHPEADESCEDDFPISDDYIVVHDDIYHVVLVDIANIMRMKALSYFNKYSNRGFNILLNCSLMMMKHNLSIDDDVYRQYFIMYKAAKAVKLTSKYFYDRIGNG